MNTKFKSLSFYSRPSPKTKKWEVKLKKWVKNHYPNLLISPSGATSEDKKADLLVVLGGDGTILEAARTYQHLDPLILGLNLGYLGFLASERKSENFMNALQKTLKGGYEILERMMIQAALERSKKEIIKMHALNDVVIQNLFGVVNLEVAVENYPIQYIRGNGVLVSTATGSTAYNLSANGPIVMPEIKCFIITELLDHNTPTPSLVVKHTKTVTIKVEDFRKTDKFYLGQSKKPVDVILGADSETVPLMKGDKIIVKKSDRLARFVELSPNYFFQSLQEKFSFK